MFVGVIPVETAEKDREMLSAHIGSKDKQRQESQLKSQLKLQLKSKETQLRDKICILLSINGECSKSEIATELEQKQVSGQLHKVIRELVDEGIIEYTIPHKPQSRLQKYRLTKK